MVRFMMSERFAKRRSDEDTQASEPPRKRVCLSQESLDSQVSEPNWDKKFTELLQKPSKDSKTIAPTQKDAFAFLKMKLQKHQNGQTKV
jgi:hypothetical protein